MLSLSSRRDSWSLLIRLLLVLGLVAANAVIGLKYQRLPLSLVLAAAAGVGLAVLALRDMPAAQTLFVVSAGTVSFSLGTGTLSSLNVAMLMASLFSGVWLLRMVVTRRFRLVSTPLNRPLAAFLVAGAASFICGLAIAGMPGGRQIAGLKVQAGQYGIWALTAAIFLLSVNHPVGERTLRFWTGFLVLVGVAVMAAGIVARRYSVLPGWSGGLYMWPVVLLLAQILFNRDLDDRLKLLGLGGLGLWAIWAVKVALVYKSIFAPALIAFVILVFLKSKRLFFLAAAAALIVVVVVSPARIERALTAGEESSASPVRSNLWVDVFRLGSRSPLLGLGPANYTYYWSDQTFQSRSYEYVNRYAWTRQVYAPPAHNMFADLFAQTGAVGLLLFTWALAGGLRLGWKTLKRPLSPFGRAYAVAVLAGFAAQIVASFVFAEWLLPYVYNLGFGNFPQAAYAWLLLGTLAWVGKDEGGGMKDEGGRMKAEGRGEALRPSVVAAGPFTSDETPSDNTLLAGSASPLP